MWGMLAHLICEGGLEDTTLNPFIWHNPVDALLQKTNNLAHTMNWSYCLFLSTWLIVIVYRRVLAEPP